MKVTGAALDQGLLWIELKREVPEAPKPRKIEIGGGSGPKAVAQDNHVQQSEVSKAA